MIIIKTISRAPLSLGLEALHNNTALNRTTTTTTTKHTKAAYNSTAANNTDQKRQKKRGGATEDIAKPEYSTCNRCSIQDENLETSSVLKRCFF